MDDYVWWLFGSAIFVASEVVVSCQGIEDLSAFCEVTLQGEDVGFWVWKVHEIEIEDLEQTC